MSSVAQELVSNYTHICEQMKRLYAEIAVLRQRKEDMEKDLKQLLEHVDGPGIVVEGVQVSIEKRQQRTRMGQKRRREEVLRVLAAHNVPNPESVFSELTKVGDVKEKNVVKIKTK